MSLKLLWGMTSISENPSVMMPRLSAELAGDRKSGPLPVLVPSDRFLIMWPSESCPFYSCIFLLSGQGPFCEAPTGVCGTRNTILLALHSACVCVRICIIFLAFLVLVCSGSQLWCSPQIIGTGVRIPNQESLHCPSLAMGPWAVRLRSWSLFYYHETPRTRIRSSWYNCEDEMR